MRPTSLLVASAVVLAVVVVALPLSSHADVTAVEGLAFNYYTDVSLLDGPHDRRGYGQPSDAPESAASPSVECPEAGGTDTDSKPEGARAVYGPAVLFGGIWPEENDVAPPSGPLTSTIDCELGEGGGVTASTSVTRNPAGTTWTTPGGSTESHPGGVGPGPFVADEVHSSCTATEEGVTSEVTIVNGILETQYSETGEPTETEPVPQNPPVNYTREGTLDHVDDSYRITFNEQIDNPDGTFTVNAVHMELLGPNAKGHMVIGSSTCGVEATAPSDTDGPCPPDPEPAPFADRDEIPPAHLPNVDCAALLEIVKGFADDTFRPRSQVRRDQMASFIARSLQEAGVELPPAGSERFGDVPPGSPHNEAIHRLAAAEIVQGGPGNLPADSYGPGLRVRRDQMASFLVRAAEFGTGRQLASQTQAFADVPPSNPHFANVNGAAQVGLAQGFGDDTYRPAAVVRRDQMSSFIVRLLTELAAEE